MYRFGRSESRGFRDVEIQFGPRPGIVTSSTLLPRPGQARTRDVRIQFGPRPSLATSISLMSRPGQARSKKLNFV